MNKKTSSLTAAVLGALIGGAVVWSVMKDNDSPAGNMAAGAAGSTLRTNEQAGGLRAAAPGSGDITQGSGKSGGQQTERQSVRGSGNTAGMRPANLPAQATVIDQVVVPIPSEIFGILDKLGKPQWREVLRPQSDSAAPRGGTEETALLLGYVIAEGFVAVEAEDVEKVKAIGKNVLNLAEAIGVRKAVVRRSNAIVEAADRREWPRVRKEFDGALSDVKEAMRELNSDSTADLVSLGGWIRGTDALANVVRVDYKQDTADLLHQPGLVDHFSGKLTTLPKRSQELPIVNTMLEGLGSIRQLMGTGADTVSKEAVEQIGQTTGNLVQVIEGKRTR